MALGFRMGASGEKPRTETYNVTQNGTFDRGAKNLYRYVKANVEAPTPTVVRLSHDYASNMSESYTFSITRVEGCVPLIQLGGTTASFYVSNITEDSLTVVKTSGTSAVTTVYVNVVWVPNVKNVKNFYNQYVNTSGSSFSYGFNASSTNKVLINPVLFHYVSSPVQIYQNFVGSTTCTLHAVGANISHALIQIFEFK